LRPHALIIAAITSCTANRPAPEPPPPAPPVVVAAPEPPAVAIVDTPLPFDDDRKALTLAYLRAHVDPAAASIDIVPHVIVLHWTGSPTFESAFATFSPSRLEGSRPELEGAGDLNVSSQFLVDRDGTIHRLMPETTMARHAIGLNQDAIGVENVGGDADHPLTDAQIDADAALVRYLAGKYPIEVVIGHYEYRSLEGTPYFQELDPDYRTAKDDPGPEFMAAVRAKIADLKLGP
jgi:N-acetylmuramoyl-L-alanine amidase